MYVYMHVYAHKYVYILHLKHSLNYIALEI